MKRFLVFLFVLMVLIPSFAKPGAITITEVVPPKSRMSTQWTFVIDGSSSLWTEGLQTKCSLLKKSNTAFQYATSFPTDELDFNIFLFAGDANKEKHVYRDWAPVNPNEINKARAWMTDNMGPYNLGLYSHGGKSIELALKQKIGTLSIIIITDGGFTSACYGKGFKTIEDIIIEGQNWRLLNGYSKASICTIGIENRHYFGGGKPDDEICQKFLKKIGSDYYGGYFYVSAEHTSEIK